MSYAVSLKKRLVQLKKAGAELPDILRNAAHEATLRAVEAAADATPPKAGTGRGPYIGRHTLTGRLKESWAESSETEPERQGNSYTTILANEMEYASYVDQGHRMDKHFVPGLYVENGVLNYDPAKGKGLTVGTRTRFVKGEFMVDKAKKAYEDAVLSILDGEIKKLLK